MIIGEQLAILTDTSIILIVMYTARPYDFRCLYAGGLGIVYENHSVGGCVLTFEDIGNTTNGGEGFPCILKSVILIKNAQKLQKSKHPREKRGKTGIIFSTRPLAVTMHQIL